jgi:hypothetical protein
MTSHFIITSAIHTSYGKCSTEERIEQTREKLNVSTIKSVTSVQLTEKSKKLLYEMYEVDFNYFYSIKHEKTFSYS